MRIMRGYRLIGIYLFIILAAICWLCSCKSVEFVPVEIVNKEYVHTTDTVHQTDSVKTEKETIIREARPEDSVMLAKMGIKLQSNERLLIMLQKELTDTRSELEKSHYKDSVRVDSIQVPYPVERKLSRWEQIKMDYGAIAIGGTIAAVILLILLIILWIKKKGM